MKILLIAAHFPPSVGGVENYVFNIALGLKQAYNHEVVVITSSVNHKKQRVENYSGIKVFRLPVMVCVSNTPINPLWYFTLKKIIRDEQPDIINAHMPVMFMGDLAALVSGRIPFVLTYHSGTMKKKKLPIDILIYLYEKCVLPRTAHKATRIICASHFVRNTLLKRYASKITVVSPGVNTSLYRPDSEVKREENRILFIARHKNMFAMKGLYYLMDAVEMLPGVQLRIVGEKDDCDKANIEFAGLKQGQDLAEEMQRAAIVVLPSLAHMESFGMVLIEAMACQTPVIGTNAGGIPEVITEGVDGFIVPVKNSDALALAIAKLLADKELAASMGQQGLRKVKEKFTWETRVELTKEVFVSCLWIHASKPNIIQVISYYPPHLGGMENCAAQIAEGFADKGYPVEVYTSNIGCSHIVLSETKARVHYLKSLEFAHTPLIFSLFFKLLSIPRFSVMHVHISQAYAPEIVYVISKLRKIPFVAHIHLDVDASGPFGFLLNPYKKVFLRRVLKAASRIICLSEPQKKLIADKYDLPLDAITVIPNGVGETYFTHNHAKDNPVPHLLFVGRLAPQKNLPLLLEAISQMKEKVFLDIVGEGEDRLNIEGLMIKHRLQNVLLHGKKTGKELIDLYRSADIFVLPSIKEGVSLSMLEALAAGLPVVASDSPEIREILADCGLLIKEPTSANYAQALDALVTDRNRIRTMSTLSVQKARSYSWVKVLNAIEEVYQEVKCDNQ